MTDIRILAILLLSAATTHGMQANTANTPTTSQQKIEQAYSQGRHGDVIKLATTALQGNPQDHAALYMRASSQVEIGRATGNAARLRDGIKDARDAIKLSGTSRSNYYLPYLFGMTVLSQVEQRPAHAEMAVEIANNVIPSEKKPAVRANLFYQRARAFTLLKKFNRAESDFRDAIRKDKTLLAAHLELAAMFAISGKPKRAKETFDETVRAFPRTPIAYNDRGIFLQQSGENELAVSDFTMALQLSPQFVNAYTNRGFSLLAMRDPEAAELDLSASLAINDKQPMVKRFRASCYLLQAMPDRAIADLQSAVEMRPQDASAHADLGFAYVIASNFDAGAKHLQSSLKLDPKQRHIRPWLFAAMMYGSQPTKAQNQFTPEFARIKGKAKDTNWNDWLVGAVNGMTKSDQLLSLASSDPKMTPGRTTEAHYFLGLGKEIAGKPTDAIKHYSAAVKLDQAGLAAYRGALIGLDRVKKSSAK